MRGKRSTEYCVVELESPSPELIVWISSSSEAEEERKKTRPNRRKKHVTNSDLYIPSQRKRRKAEACRFTLHPSLGEARYAGVPVVGKGVEVRKSTIPDAGNGVFASRPFKKGELITEYVGEIITRDEAKVRTERGQFQFLSSLVWGVSAVDGIRVAQEGVGAGSLINHSATFKNASWDIREDKRSCLSRLFAKASRNIEAGEEIFLDYGKTYWKRMQRWSEARHRGIHLLDDSSSPDEDAASDYSYLYHDYHDKPREPVTS